jgi:hypothetical protein
LNQYKSWEKYLEVLGLDVGHEDYSLKAKKVGEELKISEFTLAVPLKSNTPPLSAIPSPNNILRLRWHRVGAWAQDQDRATRFRLEPINYRAQRWS